MYAIPPSPTHNQRVQNMNLLNCFSHTRTSRVCVCVCAVSAPCLRISIGAYLFYSVRDHVTILATHETRFFHSIGFASDELVRQCRMCRKCDKIKKNFPINSRREQKQFLSWKSMQSICTQHFGQRDSDAISLESAGDTALNGCIGRNDDKDWRQRRRRQQWW